MTSNPFAAFSFTGSAPGAAHSSTTAAPALLPGPKVASRSITAALPRSTAAVAAKRPAAKAEAHDNLCLWSGVDHFSEADRKRRKAACAAAGLEPSEAAEVPADASAEDVSGNCARRLAEYELVASFRRGRRASVDEFNEFLLSLRGPRGRYWALVACLCSVQCLDSVALRVAGHCPFPWPPSPSPCPSFPALLFRLRAAPCAHLCF